MFVDTNKPLSVNEGILNGETPSYDEKL